MKRRHAVALGVLTACTPGGKAALSIGAQRAATSAPSTSVEDQTTTPTSLDLPPDPTTTVVRVTVEAADPATVVLPEDTDAELTDADRWAAEGERSGILSCIRSYEGDYDSDTGNGYFGAYQFDADTWASMGGIGNPAEAAPQEQDDRAWRLYQERGLSPWPTPQAMC